MIADGLFVANSGDVLLSLEETLEGVSQQLNETQAHKSGPLARLVSEHHPRYYSERERAILVVILI